MSRIKQEIDRAMEYYGDRASVFRVVRRATNSSIFIKRVQARLYRMQGKRSMKFIEDDDRRNRYIHHIRRLLSIDRPVTTERLKQEYDYSEGNAILRKELTERPAKFIAALQDYLEQE